MEHIDKSISQVFHIGFVYWNEYGLSNGWYVWDASKQHEYGVYDYDKAYEELAKLSPISMNRIIQWKKRIRNELDWRSNKRYFCNKLYKVFMRISKDLLIALGSFNCREIHKIELSEEVYIDEDKIIEWIRILNNMRDMQSSKVLDKYYGCRKMIEVLREISGILIRELE